MNKDEIIAFLKNEDEADVLEFFQKARDLCDVYYGKKVFFRGLIEFTNYCKQNCYYCGLQRNNHTLTRYRLNQEEILDCCKRGNELGFRTFVLQGGEDPYYTDAKMAEIVFDIKETYPDCTITLSIGERSKKAYQMFYDAGADRYLLRHETANAVHYNKLHPEEMLLESRKNCLYDLKEIGFQVGAGMMVGSPFQTFEMLAEDLAFLQELEPNMVGIGPFLPQSETRFSGFPAGSAMLTLKMVALTRTLLPKALLPATTALGSLCAQGRERAMLCGANVVMPNLSPQAVRENYAIYDYKKSTGLEASEFIDEISENIKSIGLEPCFERGDAL